MKPRFFPLFRDEGEVIATWGQARLIKYLNGRAELKGGTREDRLPAQEWMSLFWHEAVVGGLTGSEIVVDADDLGRKIELGMAKTKIKAIREQESELRANLLQLSEACPFHLANPTDCPLFALRKMEPRKRLQWFNALSESDLAYLATYHRVCLTIRVESGSAKLQAEHP